MSTQSHSSVLSVLLDRREAVEALMVAIERGEDARMRAEREARKAQGPGFWARLFGKKSRSEQG